MLLVNLHHGNAAEHRRLLFFGIVFLTLLATFIGTSIAVYQKVFEPVTMVTIKADRAGLQLAKFGDVRVHGVLVGQVRGIDQDGKQASIKVGLKPDAAKNIPSNVSVEILPTTLFGQKYISFVDPESPSGKSLADGDVIPSDRVETNVELSRILADLFPLLRSVRPADLNATLNALATALAGRGEEIGETMDKLGSYLGAIESHLPTLRKDLILLGEVAETYSIAAPDLIDVLRNATVTSQTVLDNKENLGTFFADVTGLAGTTTRILRENETDLIRMGEVTEPLLNLLAVYSPEFPCLLRGLDRYDDYLGDMFAGDRVKQYVELGATQYAGYTSADRPQYGEVGHGPWCAGLPNPQVPYPPVPALKDGDDRTLDDSPTAFLQDPSRLLDLLGISATSRRNVTMGEVGTAADQKITSSLLAARSGSPADSYGSMPSLLYGPLMRGAEVSS
ncbi:MCE family protein [Nocardioides sp. Root140]|uniref:MCE family protein n=1 Tax=Nocardioides sp. Root140 TaxID=1736460 RepID=UPI0006FF867E|nr:MCE family protein [Nocardioides sp. Root140]KQY64138.1 virulence factor Mce [Nocardioides sp. Root140]